jgi:hypothetical protein
MKTITLWQPWSSLVAIGAKPYEFRKWAAPRWLIGQRIAIHAGARPVRAAEVRKMLIDLASSEPWRSCLRPEIAKPFLMKVVENPTAVPHGCIVATAILGAPVRADKVLTDFGGPVEIDSDRGEHFNFAWPMLEVEEMQPPILATGHQGFWDWTQ